MSADDDALAHLDYALPDELIARFPPPERDGGRLLDMRGAELRDGAVGDLVDAVAPGDVVVLNDTRVLQARVHARRHSGGRVQVFFLADDSVGSPVKALVRPGRRVREGESLEVPGAGSVTLLQRLDGAVWRVRADPSAAVLMSLVGEVPLPPYLGRAPREDDRDRYQTVYARHGGAVAAPTAGLHLTPALIEAWRALGAEVHTLTLHVGAGTFRPLEVDNLVRGELHEEAFEVPVETAEAVARARSGGGRVFAVGTTATRALESAATPDGQVRAGPGRTRLFIQPGYRFAVVDRLLTNFHLPRSSLLSLVQAFAGRARVDAAYRHAVAARYRFYSYGDAMLLDRDPS